MIGTKAYKTLLRRGDLIAVASVLAAAVLTFAAAPLFNGRAPMLFFLVAVTFSAAREGLRSGLVATALSVVAMSSVFGKTITLVLAGRSQFALFAIVAVASTFLLDRLHRTNAALIRAQQETEVANRRLLDHAESLALANARLAEHKEALALAHEELRRAARVAALDMKIPLKVISDYTSVLDQPRADITTEVLRLETMIADLGKHAAAGDPAAPASRQGLARTDISRGFEPGFEPGQ